MDKMKKYLPKKYQFTFILITIYVIPQFILIPSGIFFKRLLMSHFSVHEAAGSALPLISQPLFLISQFILAFLGIIVEKLVFSFSKQVHLLKHAIIGSFYIVGSYYLHQHLLITRLVRWAQPENPALAAAQKTLPIAVLIILGIYATSFLVRQLWPEQNIDS